MEKKLFNDYLIDIDFQPHELLIKAFDTNDFPFLKNKFFNYNPAFLAAQEFNRCVENYNEKTPGSGYEDLSYIIAMMIVNEDKLHNSLEILAIKTIQEMYDIPDDRITLKTKIEWIDENPVETIEKEKEIKVSEERKPILKLEIEKRRILNSIVHGAAIHQWVSASHIISEELNELNPNLLKIYDQYGSLINYMNWLHPIALNNNTDNLYQSRVDTNTMNFFMTQGLCHVTNKGKKGKIETQAICFPVALHELSKGVLDYLINKGLPCDLPENELKYVLRTADKYQHEWWHYYMGPTLWRAILKTSDLESQKLPKIISAMAKMNYDELAEFCIDITFHAEEKGIEKMNNLKKKLKI